MGYSDHVQATGSSGGQMLIRVADSAGTSGVISSNDIKFFVRSGLSATFVGSPGFGTKVYANGGWITLDNVANYSNSTAFREVGTIHVTTNQTITFHIDASGTSGFGGPTDFPLAISRATVPAAPTAVSVDLITHTDFRYKFSGNSNGGSAILEWQVGYGYSSSTPTWFAPSSGTITVSAFTPGKLVYIWSRGRNAVGWSAWSARLSSQMKRGVKIFSSGTWHDAVPYVRDAGVWKPFEPYVRVSGVWKLAGAN